MKIRLLLTGGTIDKDYNEADGSLGFTKTHLESMLHQGRSRAQIAIQQVLMIDSLDMTDEHRQIILKTCRDAAEDRIVITHGTDSMAETARLLGSNLSGKTVVLTGAMVPYSFGTSDALFNLGSAITAVQLLGEGVYVAMNGKIFPGDNVKKNNQLSEFETLKS